METKFQTEFRRKLLQWYRKYKRDLPWRKTRDPYAIWVSEIMLQQTQVATVIPFYRRFLHRFPDLQSLAKAEEEEVLAQWAGLGYYRRAKLLQRGAREVLVRHGGELPDNVEALEALPGIGPYTAGAISSIAFQKPSPLVDGNVVRVLSRVFLRQGHAKSPALQKEIWAYAKDLVDPNHPGDFNQALMELGATVCRVALPSCGRCPLLGLCAAKESGDPEAYPETPPAQKTLRLERAVAVALDGEAILLIKLRQSRWFQGMWGLPHEYVAETGASREIVAEFLENHLGIRFPEAKALPSTRHSITHHRIDSSAWIGQSRGKPQIREPIVEARFFSPQEITAAALPNFDRKVLEAADII